MTDREGNKKLTQIQPNENWQRCFSFLPTALEEVWDSSSNQTQTWRGSATGRPALGCPHVSSMQEQRVRNAFTGLLNACFMKSRSSLSPVSPLQRLRPAGCCWPKPPAHRRSVWMIHYRWCHSRPTHHSSRVSSANYELYLSLVKIKDRLKNLIYSFIVIIPARWNAFYTCAYCNRKGKCHIRAAFWIFMGLRNASHLLHIHLKY